jgi:hypothetical protein
MDDKEVSSSVLYRGFNLAENGKKVVFYIFAERQEFDTLPQATSFIDDWYKNLVIGIDIATQTDKTVSQKQRM